MEKRRLLIGDYDTAADGLWTLAACKLTKAAQVQTFVSVPGRVAPLDLSTYLTDGQPYYDNATLEAILESSEGDRLARKLRIDLMVNYLDGQTVKIYLPDDTDHYLVGRVQVSPEYNDLAHAAVTVSAVCDPWLYAIAERVYTLTAAATAQTAVLTNNGRRTLVPKVTVTGAGASVRIVSGAYSVALGPGTYDLPDLLLTTGNTPIKYSGSGVAKITYREAVLR